MITHAAASDLHRAWSRRTLWVPDTQSWALTRGDSRRIAFGMIDDRGVATRVPDLLSTPVRDSTARPLGHRQGRGDSRAAPSTGCLASAGRAATAVLGGSRRPQCSGSIAVHRAPSASVRHPRHAPTLARRPGQATLDLPARIPGGATGASPENSQTVRDRSTSPALGPDLGRIPAFPSTRDSGM